MRSIARGRFLAVAALAATASIPRTFLVHAVGQEIRRQPAGRRGRAIALTGAVGLVDPSPATVLPDPGAELALSVAGLGVTCFAVLARRSANT